MIIRPAEAGDKETIQKWIDKDPFHQGMKSEFFFEPYTETKIVEDESGPIMCLRISRSLRVDIQFDPTQRMRTSKALAAGFPWLTDKAKAAGFKQVIFDSVCKPLVSFCQKRFSFRQSPDEYVTEIK